MSSARFPSAGGNSTYTRQHTKSFSYAQGPPPQPSTTAPPKSDFSSFTPRQQEEASSALTMLSEILREELFLQSEEVRLADRPPERLAKLREAHKEWIVWRVRKELEKMRLWKDAEKIRAEKIEEERRQASEKERIRKEADEARRLAEEHREKAREREKTLKEERDRAAREQQQQSGRSKTPSSGPSFPWQRRFASGSGNAQKDSGGYGTDREGPAPGARPSSTSSSFKPPPRSQTTAPFPNSSTASREWSREALIARNGWDAYTARWAGLNNSVSSDSADMSSLRGLRFGDIPWPIFSTGPFTPADITSKTVGAFLLSPFHSVDKSTKDRLRAALMQWHPDKFEARWLHTVAESEKPLVTDGVGAVARAINDLIAANR